MEDIKDLEDSLSRLQINEDGTFCAESQIAGEHEALQALRELIAWPQLYGSEAKELGVEWARGLLLYGPPGCGKTKLVQAVCKECGARIHSLASSDVFGAYIGESEKRLRDVFDSAKKDALSGYVAVIFMDEVDSLSPKRASQKPHETRVVSQLLTLIDGCTAPKSTQLNNPDVEAKITGYVVVVGATNRPNAIDPALRRPGRLDREVAVSVPGKDQRLSILRLQTDGMPLSDDVNLEAIAAASHGYTGADLEAVCREATMDTIVSYMEGLQCMDKNGEHRKISSGSFEVALRTVSPSIARGYEQEIPAVHWDDIGGLDSVKKQLKRIVEWPLCHADAFTRLGLKPAKGLVLYGPPGCCKTTLARAAASESGARLLPLSCTQVYSMYVGEGEAIVRETFRRARLSAPAIILLDEVDSIAGMRDSGVDGQRSGNSRLLSTLLTEMDGLENSTGLLVLAATNRPGCLDHAFIRPGRLDVHLYVPPPDLDGRHQTLQIHTRDMPLTDDVNLMDIAVKTDFFTGADLAGLCREAAICALRDDVDGSQVIDRRHFETALLGLKPSVSQQDLRAYELWGIHTR